MSLENQLTEKNSKLPEHVQNLLSKSKIVSQLDLKNSLNSVLFVGNISSAFAVFTTPLGTFQKHGFKEDEYYLVRRHYAAQSFPGFIAGMI